MAKSTKKHAYTNEDFEAKAQEIMSMALAMCEKRVVGFQQQEAPNGYAMTRAVMTLNFALKTFLTISRLEGK